MMEVDLRVNVETSILLVTAYEGSAIVYLDFSLNFMVAYIWFFYVDKVLKKFSSISKLWNVAGSRRDRKIQ